VISDRRLEEVADVVHVWLCKQNTPSTGIKRGQKCAGCEVNETKHGKKKEADHSSLLRHHCVVKADVVGPS
jgi:hypothetical protein